MNPSPENNIVSLLDAAAARRPGRRALVFGPRSIAFDELLRQVQRAARLFSDHGLEPGQRVILMIPMSIDLYIAMLAIIRCGATAVFVDPWMPLRQIAAFSAFAEPCGLIGVPKSHVLRLMSRGLARLPFTVTTGRSVLGFPARFSLRELEAQPAGRPCSAVALEDPALITFTSGSSGIPKGANRTHGFLKAQYEALCTELDYADGDVDMPMFPVFALRNLAAGITSVIPDMDFRKVAEVHPDSLQRQIEANGVTLVTASPPLVDRLAGLAAPPALRHIFTGGAPVTDEQLERWHTAFPDTAIDILYGSTEAEPVAHLSSRERLEEPAAKGCCCGTPSNLLRTRIIAIRKTAVAPDELEALTLAPGETGELLVAGRHVCRDYFRNPEAVLENKITEPDGTCWHRMGDTGYMDPQGRFVLTGRVHSTILRRGRVLHAQQVEAGVRQRMPGAHQVAALELDGDLLIVIKGAPLSGEEPDLDADRVIFTRKSLPVDPRHNVKIDYDRLRELVRRKRL